jgi:hypothetical protein
MLAMIKPDTSAKLWLVEDRRAPAASEGMPVRRYRIARLRFESRSQDERSRFEHLKRVYD